MDERNERRVPLKWSKNKQKRTKQTLSRNIQSAAKQSNKVRVSTKH